MKTMQQTRPAQFAATLLVALCTVVLAGCGKNGGSKGSGLAPTSFPETAEPSATPPMEQVLAAWQQGDKAGAVQRFIETDWKSGPLISPGSPLSHREDELPRMSPAVLQKLMGEVNAQLRDLKQLAAAVRDEGKGVAPTDAKQARRCFSKLDEFGAALDQPDGMKIVQLVGQSIRKMAAAELAKLGK